MSTIRVADLAGNIVDIDIEETWHGFRKGDVVLRERDRDDFWHEVVSPYDAASNPFVVGAHAGNLYVQRTGFAFCRKIESPDGLILLARNRLRFKVGDSVRYVGLYGQFNSGRVIVIDPETELLLMDVFGTVALGEGNASENLWAKPWYPAQYKNNSRTRVWISPKFANICPMELVPPAEAAVSTSSANLQPAGGNAGMRTIKTETGDSVNVDTEKVWHGFKAGDVVSINDRKAILKGVDADNGEMVWFTFADNQSNGALYISDYKEVLLLERSGSLFKVGSRVAITNFPGIFGTVIVINPETGRYLVDFENWTDGHNGNGRSGNNYMWEKSWYPVRYRTDSRSRYWSTDQMLYPVNPSDAVTLIAEKNQAGVAQTMTGVETAGDSTVIQEPLKEELEINYLAPEILPWLREVGVCLESRTAHMFIVHGNIHDQIKSAPDKYQTIHEYLAETFKARHVMIYSLSRGLEFGTRETEEWFRQSYIKPLMNKNQEADQKQISSAADRLRDQLHKMSVENAPLSQLIGASPDAILSFLERVLHDKNESQKRKPLLMIDYVHNLIPTQVTAAERSLVERMERWSRDKEMRDAGSVIIMLTPALSDIAPALRSSQSGTFALRIPKPNQEARLEKWLELLKRDGLELAENVSVEMLARVTNGLSLRQIETMAAKAIVEKRKLPFDFVKEVKKKQIEEEFGGRLEIKNPKLGLDAYGGMDNVKAYLREVTENITTGRVTHRVPMGILAAGPPGTGKTFLFECWAHDAGFNFVKIANPRNKYVGESESQMEQMLAAIDDMSPVVVVEDEADQSEVSRDAPNGDSGVSNRLRQLKFEFCSASERLGKVIWVRISNRDDLIDDAYKRKGRTDDNIPFVLPDEDQYKAIFGVVFKRYGIKTDIKDFTPFAALVSSKIYCSGSDVEWMVREADKKSGRERKDVVEPAHLEAAINDWEMDLDPDKVDQQIILAIKGSSKDLRPKNWEQQLAAAKARMAARKRTSVQEQMAQFVAPADSSEVGKEEPDSDVN